MRRCCLVVVFTLLALPALAESPEWVGKDRARINEHRLKGNGRWTPKGSKRTALQRWSLSVDRDDEGRLDGVVTIDDSPLLKSGVVRGWMRDHHLSGMIVDPSGNDVAEFRGVVSAEGVRGTYTDRTGETGDWFWDAPLPE